MANAASGFGRSLLKFFGTFIAGFASGGVISVKPVDRTADEVARFIGDALDDGGGPYDWTDFKTIPIVDSQLDEIRQRAKGIPLPLDEENRAKLEQLLIEAQVHSHAGENK